MITEAHWRQPSGFRASPHYPCGSSTITHVARHVPAFPIACSESSTIRLSDFCTPAFYVASGISGANLEGGTLLLVRPLLVAEAVGTPRSVASAKLLRTRPRHLDCTSDIIEIERSKIWCWPDSQIDVSARPVRLR